MMLKEEDSDVQGKEMALICQLVEVEPVHPKLVFPLPEMFRTPKSQCSQCSYRPSWRLRFHDVRASLQK